MEGPDVTSGSPETTWLPNPSKGDWPANNDTYELNADGLFRVFPGKDSAYTICGKLRKPCNYLLVSLAVSDLCVALLVMPISMLYELRGSWAFGPTLCEVWVSFDVLSCTASILNLCMISVDRYYAISMPLEYGVKRTTKRMIMYVAFVWFGAAAISLPPLLLLGNEYTVSTSGVSQCIVCQNFGYQIYATLLSFYIPLTVMIFVYYKIFCAARKIVLEEKRAQSHLDAYCHLDIEQHLPPPIVQQKPTQFDSQINHGRDGGSSPVAEHHHRSSSASTTCSAHAVKCFVGGPRKSNESQCPMLQPFAEKQPILTPTSQCAPAAPSTGCGSGGGGGGGAGPRRSASAGRQRKHASSTSSEANSPHKQKRLRLQLVKERKASTTLGIIMSAFTVCWVPFFLLTVIRIFLSDPSRIPTALSSTFLWLGYCNSLLNPIIYATLNRDFRKPFREILYCRCGNLQHMMREEFYYSQYGGPVNNYVVKSTCESAPAAVDAGSPDPPSESFL
ncbi:5-hydroxytryptamine receptor 1-like isoform X2 [Phymastichus coffea]|uniref:5-hydroxytryptamine receptor 1-like isoform X2 n=1 Tax=Phymastichus coffea TaxID=108790 RepID=UPI00273C7E40|nr:5-hydroxytryptamine receptor 1-like isoform X2 [Phymastichus coffea]